MEVETLQLLPEEKWPELEVILKSDWPRSILAIDLLDTLRKFPDLREKFEYKIYCPYGDVTIGVVAISAKKYYNEALIHCNHGMEKLLDAIQRTKVINWEFVIVQFSEGRVMESVISAMRSSKIECHPFLEAHVLYMDICAFDIEIHQDVRFGFLSEEHVAQVSSTKFIHYPGWEWYYEQLVKSNLGYGLFEKKTNKLVAWMFSLESGVFSKLYVEKLYRRKGYAELLIKESSNTVLKNRKYIYGFAKKDNKAALELYEKIGLKIIGETLFTTFKRNTQSKI